MKFQLLVKYFEGSIHIRSANFKTGKDIAFGFNFRGAAAHNANGMVNVSQGMMIPAGNAIDDIGYTAQISYGLIGAGADESGPFYEKVTPIDLGASTLLQGGNHGCPCVIYPQGSFTTVDIGSQWHDTNGVEWLLFAIRFVSGVGNCVCFVSKNTSTADGVYAVATAMPVGNLTHYAGAVHTSAITATAAGTQFFDLVRNVKQAIVVDGTFYDLLNPPGGSASAPPLAIAAAEKIEVYDSAEFIDIYAYAAALVAQRPSGGYVTLPADWAGAPSLARISKMYDIQPPALQVVYYKFEGKKTANLIAYCPEQAALDATSSPGATYHKRYIAGLEPVPFNGGFRNYGVGFDESIGWNALELLTSSSLWTNGIPPLFSVEDWDGPLAAHFVLAHLPVKDGYNRQTKTKYDRLLRDTQKNYPYAFYYDDLVWKDGDVREGVMVRGWIPRAPTGPRFAQWSCDVEGFGTFIYALYQGTGTDTIAMPAGYDYTVVYKSQNVSLARIGKSDVSVEIGASAQNYGYAILCKKLNTAAALTSDSIPQLGLQTVAQSNIDKANLQAQIDGLRAALIPVIGRTIDKLSRKPRAWCGFFNESFAYTGPCMAVSTVGSGGTLIDIPFSTTAPYGMDETALAAAAAGGTLYLRKMYDQTGNGNHAIPEAGANSPKVVIAGVICRDSGGVNFAPRYAAADITGWSLPIGTGTLGAVTSTHFTTSIIFRTTDSNTEISRLPMNPWYTQILISGGNLAAYYAQLGGTYQHNLAYTTDTIGILINQMDGNYVRMTLNGGAINSVNMGSSENVPTDGNVLAIGNNMNGSIYQIVVDDVAMSSADQALLVAAKNAHY